MGFTDITAQDAHYHDAEPGKFFERPIRIASFVWSIGTAVNQSYNPWTLWMQDPRVVNRMTNYHLARFKLCVKVLVNGNAFTYGQLLMSYLPTATYDLYSPKGTGISTELILSSQRPHMYIQPTDSEGGCMELPFFYNGNWLRVTNTADLVGMGQLTFQTMNLLKHANGGTDPITVSIFAWAKDMELAVPTTVPAAYLVAQAEKTEYKGMISHPATGLAKLARSLAQVPVIGPYAKATEMAAGTVGAVASMFGLSRAPVLSPPTLMRRSIANSLANYDAPETLAKLTLDSKQELCIDSRVAGLKGDDEMSIKSIATKESYITTFDWTVAAASDAVLFSTAVNPAFYNRWNATAGQVAMTALGISAMPFKYWRGAIKFRFQVVCTPYHKGRLRIMFDPGTLASVTKFNTVYTTIVDISEVSDFEMIVHWASHLPILNVPFYIESATNWTAGGIQTVDQSYDNGSLTVAVLTDLTTPNSVANNDVQVNVFVSAGDDFEVMVPREDIIKTLTPLVNQSTPMLISQSLPGAATATFEVGKYNPNLEHLHDVVVGEKIVSMKQLLRRYQRYMAAFSTGGTLNGVRIVNRDFPIAQGYDPTDGLHLRTLAPLVRYNYVTQTWLSTLSTCYSGYRGAIRYKYVLDPDASNERVTEVTRLSGVSKCVGPTLITYTKTSNILDAYLNTINRLDSFNGSTIELDKIAPVIEFELPFYNLVRFLTPKNFPTNSTTGSAHAWEVHTTVATGTDYFDSYVSVGEDFNLFFWTGPPILFSVVQTLPA